MVQPLISNNFSGLPNGGQAIRILLVPKVQTYYSMTLLDHKQTTARIEYYPSWFIKAGGDDTGHPTISNLQGCL
jgi:hypothetical protein